jgi:hypothetical protein
MYGSIGPLGRGILTHLHLIYFDVGCFATLVVLIVCLNLSQDALYSSDDLKTRVVPMVRADESTFYGPQELSYPHFATPLNDWAEWLLIFTFVPAIVFAGFQVTTRSWWDFYSGLFGNLKALVFA